MRRSWESRKRRRSMLMRRPEEKGVDEASAEDGLVSIANAVQRRRALCKTKSDYELMEGAIDETILRIKGEALITLGRVAHIVFRNSSSAKQWLIEVTLEKSMRCGNTGHVRTIVRASSLVKGSLVNLLIFKVIAMPSLASELYH
jgi:hypothetical protein